MLVALLMAGAVSACREARRPPEVRIPPAFAVAESLRLRGRSAEALPHFERLRDSFALAGDTAGLWRAQTSIAESLNRLNRVDSSRATYAIALRLAAGNPQREADTRIGRSAFFAQRGEFDSAMVDGQIARDLGAQSRNPRLEAGGWHAIGRVYSLTGRSREAAAAHQRSYELQRAIGIPDRIALALGELAIDLRRLGRYEQAIEQYEEALVTYERLSHEEGLARTRFNLSNVYSDMGDFARAEQLLREALPPAQAIGDVRGQTFIHGSLGVVYSKVGNPEAARPQMQRAIDLSRQARLPGSEIYNLTNLAALDLAEGRIAEARPLLTRVLELSQPAGFRRERGNVRVHLAALALAERDTVAALRWADEAVAIADSVAEPSLEHDARVARAAVLEEMGRDDASTEFERAIDLLESWRGRLALGDLRMGIAEPRLSAFEGAIRTLIARGAAEDAFLIAERARARLLLELLADRVTGGSGSKLAEMRERLREQNAARGAVGNAGIRASIDTTIRRLTDSIAHLERERRATERAGSARYPAPASLATVRRALITRDRALLVYFWGDSAVYGWLVTDSGIRGLRLGATDSLVALADFLRGAIETPTSSADWRIPARRLHQAVVEPLGSVAASELFVIPDGALSYVPFEVLVPSEGASPLGATKRLIYGPSASVLSSLATSPARGGWERTVLAVGNPLSSGGRGDDSLRTDSDAPLANLPFAEEEARAVGALFRPTGADVLIGRRATLDRWREHNPGRYRYLHFAAHARANDRRPAETHLSLADSRLDLRTIRGLDLTAELVTLSACETALGPRVRGEGIVGLPHAFLAAGARGTIVTLWRIADRSAADFMSAYYRELARGGSPSAALLTVRRAWLSDSSRVAHPAHWAPFVLVGGID
ncbi:MAG TPA: CHAT domain-containing protein [Gemmatimonadaceae bacterium]|nr:CHAT domain-containing protein [Gemmatimonadaceae bacterium]